MDEERQLSVVVERLQGFEFRVAFVPGSRDLVMDEPAPTGRGEGPPAAQVLAAALGNCLSSSLLFCLQKARADVEGLHATSTAILRRNERGRWRVGSVKVSITVDAPGGPEALARCGGLFEDFCVVTESVRAGVPVEVELHDRAGNSIPTRT